jgi:hypothetical protein
MIPKLTKLIILAALILMESPMFAADLSGHYRLSGVPETASQLLLEPGGKFKYMLIYGAADYFAEGTWRADGNSVILNTAGAAAAPFRLTASSATKSGHTRVVVKAPNGNPVQHIDIVLRTAKGELKGRTDGRGEALFQDAGGASSISFVVRVYSLEAGPFDIKASDDDFTFEINGDAIRQVPFKEERLKVDGTALEMRFWNKDRPMRYLKSRDD